MNLPDNVSNLVKKVVVCNDCMSLGIKGGKRFCPIRHEIRDPAARACGQVDVRKPEIGKFLADLNKVADEIVNKL